MGKQIFNGVQGHSYAIIKTLRRLDTTWNFALHMNMSIENIVHTEFTKKRVFGWPTLAVESPARRRPGRQKVSIPECDLTGRRVTVDLLVFMKQSHDSSDDYKLPQTANETISE